MASIVPSRFRRRLTRFIRWTRNALGAGILLALGALLYLNWAGLPGFLRSWVESELRALGVDVEIERVRLRGYRRVFAENLSLARHAPSQGLRGFVPEAEIQFDRSSLRRFEFKLEGLTLRRGHLAWTLASSNEPPTQLLVEDVGTEIRSVPRDRWELRQFNGRVFGVEVRMSASLTNASGLRKWTRGSRVETASQARWLARLRGLLLRAGQIELTPPAVLTLRLEGDGRVADSFQGRFLFETPKALTPWGSLAGVNVSGSMDAGQDASGFQSGRVRLRSERAEGEWGEFGPWEVESKFSTSLKTRQLDHAEFRAGVEKAESPWAKLGPLRLTGRTVPAANQPGVLRTDLAVSADWFKTAWLEGDGNEVEGRFEHAANRWLPFEGDWKLVVKTARSILGESSNVTMSGRAAHLPDRLGLADASWGGWRLIEQLALEWRADAREIRSPKLSVDRLEAAGSWKAPELHLSQIKAALYGGQVESSSALHVGRRELSGRVMSDFDLRRISPLLTTNAQRWLRQFDWGKPPVIKADARVILPVWTNARPDWRAEALPSLALAGEFQAADAMFRKIPAQSAASHFSFTNLVWHFPDLKVARPEGEALLEHTWDMRTQEFHWRIRSGIDPSAIKPILDAKAGKFMDELRFSEPPRIDGEVRGRWPEHEKIAFSGRVEASKFTLRGEAFDEARAQVSLTNRVLTITEGFARRGEQKIHAPSIVMEAGAEVLSVTNVTSTMDPDLVTRIIGPKIRKAIKPYHFAEPPSVRVNGRIPTRQTEKADLRFEVVGKSFRYWKLNLPRVSGDVHWLGDTLKITNVLAGFYGGDLQWEGGFDFRARKGADFHFKGVVSDADLHLLMNDLLSKTNRMEGALHGTLIISSANSEDWESWNGSGKVRLRDGFLWDIPIFGFFSPILNRIAPGAGHSKASAATAPFVIERSVIRTRDLEVRSPALRLQYEGAVDFQGRVDARMQAEILRDAWAVGKVVSLALWPLAKIFEYKVTGTLAEPKTEPLYIPDFLMWPLQPFKTLKQILTPPVLPPPAEGQKPPTPADPP